METWEFDSTYVLWLKSWMLIVVGTSAIGGKAPYVHSLRLWICRDLCNFRRVLVGGFCARESCNIKKQISYMHTIKSLILIWSNLIISIIYY